MTTAARWSEPDELLLRAAIGSGDEADHAYATWRRTQDLRDVGSAAHRVLPLLAERLDGEDDPVAQQVRRVVRFTWLRTQFLIERCIPGIRALREADVPVMLVKGAAVLAHTDWQIQLRPMDDLDIAVHREHAPRAARVLLKAGLHQASLPQDPAATRIYDQIHALPFNDVSGAELDLHWHVLHGSLHRGADAAFWERSRAAQIRDVPVSVLAAEDTFVEVAGHGMQMNVEHPLRWAADAVLLLRATPGFDWDLVAETASRHRMTDQIGPAIAALARVAPEVVPAVLPRALRPRRRRSSPLVSEFVRRTVAPGEAPRPGHVAAYVKEVWALDRGRDIPAHAAWVAGGRRPRLAPRDRLPGAAPAPHVGAELGFHAGAAGTALLGPGWWAPDTHGTWSRGREAVMWVPAGGGDVEPQFWLVPYLTAARTRLELDVFADGAHVARWVFLGARRTEEQRTLRLRRGTRSVIPLRFVQRSSRISPAMASDFAEPRPLGFALRRMRVTPA